MKYSFYEWNNDSNFFVYDTKNAVLTYPYIYVYSDCCVINTDGYDRCLRYHRVDVLDDCVCIFLDKDEFDKAAHFFKKSLE